jgi:hypothetical protein
MGRVWLRYGEGMAWGMTWEIGAFLPEIFKKFAV